MYFQKTPLLDSNLTTTRTYGTTAAAGDLEDTTAAGQLSPSPTLRVDDEVGGDEESALLPTKLPAGIPPKQAKEFHEIWIILLGLWFSVFCSTLGGTLVTNLQFEIASEFSKGHLASWLGGGFLLGNAALTPLHGRLCDIFGRRAAMLNALFFYVTGTIICSLARSMPVMICGRVISGAGGGGLFSIPAIIVADLVSLADRGLYQGLVNVVATLGMALGATLGGYVADSAGWRATFYLQLPLLAVATVLVLWKVHLPMVASEQTWFDKLKRVDWLGSVFIISAVSTLMIALSLHTSFDMPMSHPSVAGLLAASLVSAAIFYVIEEWFAKEPLLPMSILRMWTPCSIMLALLFYMANFMGRNFMLPIYLKQVRGFSSQLTGTLLLPGGVSGSLASLVAGAYMKRTGRYKKLTLVAGILPLLSNLSVMRWGLDTSIHRLWLEIALSNLGGGAVVTTLSTGLIANLPQELIATAIACSFLLRSIGQVLGVSIAFSIEQLALDKALSRRLGDASKELIRRIIHTPSTTIPTLPPAERLQVVYSYLTSIQVVFTCIAVWSLCIIIFSSLMREYKLPGRG